MNHIPKNAKKMFKGVIFDVYQWEQKMFDGSFSTFEKLKRSNTVLAIPTMGGKIIVNEELQPDKVHFFTLPGGRQDPTDNTPLDCIKRELLEEAGLVSDKWNLYKSYRPYNKIDWEIFIYIARDCKKVARQKLDCGEKIKSHALNFDEFIELVLSDDYWGHELTEDVLRMKLDNKKLEEFHEKLFGGS